MPKFEQPGRPEEEVEGKKILRGIVFEPGRTDPTKFSSSAPNRKIVIMDKGIIPPLVRVSYDVVVVRDTRPKDPHRGAYIVQYAGVGEVPAENSADEDLEAPIAEKKEVIPDALPIELDAEAGVVYVLETVIPYNSVGGEAVPRHERFTHFTLDERTLEILEKAATAVELREPMLLEGETSTSKTSAIEYLAMVSNNEVVRLNLNGQSDTSELVGKFVPNDGQLQISFQELLRNRALLSETSIDILTRANTEGRGLSLLESQRIAENEHLKVSDWRWQDGLDIQAKKKGQWLILDEINLAEPQILERLNSQLEKSPSIVLSENGGTVIRELSPDEEEKHREGKLTGIEPLHPNFRIFATMNPAEYSGRQPMSPAFKDRWGSYMYVSPPTEKQLTAMMEKMIYGEDPEVVVRGVKYSGHETLPPENILRDVPNFRGFLPLLARFVTRIESMARTREIGKGKKEPYIFTRRGLLLFLGYLEGKTFFDRQKKEHITVKDAPEVIISRAIEYYFLDKIRGDSEDMKKVKDQLDAIGISEANWTYKFQT